MRIETKKELGEILAQSGSKTTQEIAEIIGLSRSATSLYLNELLEKKAVVKSGTRPVYWSLVEQSIPITDLFSRYIGHNGSAKSAIEKCKAAVCYPPLGLPLLLHGASGVGKSFLAQLIFDYLHQGNYSGAEKFFVFNCADYANNPELLSSILFGHTKGAFTGADSEKKGLLLQANNGVLFLDEVHRLSEENQEKLFQFLDTGTFRPMGEGATKVHSNVRLLFATTEDPVQSLLTTFYRRISVIVDLPSFHERPIFERIDLVNYLFYREAKRIHKEIEINPSHFDELIHQELAGNVGSLVNLVRMACANGLRNHVNQDLILIGEKDRNSIKINPDVPQNVTNDHQGKLIEEFCALSTILDSKKLKFELELFDKKYLNAEKNVLEDQLATRIKREIQNENRLIIDNEELTSSEVERVCRFIQMLKENLLCYEFEMQWDILKKEYPRTAFLSENLSKKLPKEVKDRIAFFLGVLLIDKVNEEIRYQVLLVAHGNTTATSIQAVANKMCGDYIFDAINMPLTSSIRDIIFKVKYWLSKRDTSEGVIMLVDMGSLTQLYKSLKPQILGELLVINNLTTSYALAIGQELMNGQLFYEIAKVAEENFTTEIQYFEGFAVEKNLIISSISGRDISKKIRDIFFKYVNSDIKLIVLNYNELVQTFEKAYMQEGYLKETALVLTTSYLENQTPVPTINLIDLLDEDAENQLNNKLNNLVHPNSIPFLINEFIHFFSKEGLSEKLEFLNPEVIIKQVETVVEKCEKRFAITLTAKMKFNLMMHLSLMVERTILGSEDYPVPNDMNELLINQRPFYQNVHSIFYTIEQFYRITISEWEFYVLYEILIG